MSAQRLQIGSLFSGIGGLDMSAEAAGLGQTAFQVEIDAYASRVLRKHWPGALHLSDVREVGRHNLPHVDVLVGGSPCQGFSQAGKREGFCDPRSALWREMYRIAVELDVPVVIVENVIEMFRKGLHLRVVEDLERAGYVVAPPLVINAASIGAPHRRSRVFIIAYKPGTHLDLPPLRKVDWRYPALRGATQKPGEPPRTLPKATRYPGLYKRERLHALGNAVMPSMGFIAALYARKVLGADTGGFDFAKLAVEPKLPESRYWPTPVTTDAKGARRETARTEAWESKPGTTLTDAVWLEGERGRPLNPEWVEALMSFPVGFTLA